MRKPLATIVILAVIVATGVLTARASETKLTLPGASQAYTSSISETDLTFNRRLISVIGMSDAPSLQLFHAPHLTRALVTGRLLSVMGTGNAPRLQPHGRDLTGASVTRDASSYDSDMGAPLTISFSGTDFMNTVAGGRFITSYTVTEMGGSATATQQPVDGTSNTLVRTRASIDSPLGFGGDIILHNKTGYGGGPVGPGDYSLGFSRNTVLQTKISHGGISAGPSDYSLTIQDTSNANGSSADLTTTGDIAAGPELGTMVLFGTGLVVLGGVLRRRLAA